MLAVVTGCYITFLGLPLIHNWTPYNFKIKQFVSLFFILTVFLNGIVNPLVYAWMNKDFNTAFRKILHIKVHTGDKKKRSVKEPDTSVSSVKIQTPDS